jgi:hypothetical protein
VLARLKSLFGNLVIYGVGDVAINVVSLLLLPIYTRYLTPSDYGVIAMLLTIEAVAKVVFRWGVDTAFMRLYYDCVDTAARQRLASTIFFFLLAANDVRLTVRDRVALFWVALLPIFLTVLVDVLGLCGYFALAEKGQPQDLPGTWRKLRAQLETFAQGRPILFTEIGYLSLKGAAAWPWDEGATGAVDLEEQRRCYAAFCRTWAGAPSLAGVYFWNWYGWGGDTSRGYTPRGKPAAEEIRAFFR